MGAKGNSDLRAAVGQLLCVGFDGPKPSDDILRLLGDYQIGNVILFRRNIQSVSQVIALTNALQEHRSTPTPLMIGVDQEGGPVARLRGIITDFPPMATLGATGDMGLAHAYGSCLGEELDALGINMNFAPVADLHTRDDNPVIGNRSFGSDPELVGHLVAAQVRGMEAGGLLACAKHFPGHGDTDVDSHRGLPVIPHGIDRLEAHELRPFIAAIEAGVPAIMTAHILFPHLDDKNPATMSPAILTQLLRQRLSFDGVIISDDLEMKAITQDPGVEAAVLRGLRAGVDIFLICHSIERQIGAFEALIHAGESDAFMRARIFESANRVAKMKDFIDDFIPRDIMEAVDTIRNRNTVTLAKEITHRGEAALKTSGISVNAPQPTAPELINT